MTLDTDFYAAIEEEEEDEVAAFLAKPNLNVNVCGPMRYTALHLAATKKNLALVKLLTRTLM